MQLWTLQLAQTCAVDLGTDCIGKLKVAAMDSDLLNLVVRKHQAAAGKNSVRRFLPGSVDVAPNEAPV